MSYWRRIPIATLLIPFASLIGRADGIVFFPKPRIESDRSVHIIAPEEVIPVHSGSPMSVFIFKEAQKSCGIDLQNLDRTFQRLLAPDNKLFAALDQFFGTSYDSIARQPLSILIDDLGPGRTEFSSYYFPEIEGAKGPVILLDCATTSQLFWTSSLAHELTHALLHEKNVDSWFDEGLAQIMETEAGGVQPEFQVSQFARIKRNPTLIETRRPLPGKNAYAFSYLLLKYLRARFGGWPTLRAMAGFGEKAPECGSGRSFLARSLCRAREHAQNTPELSRLAEKMTPRGLLRFFAVAMTLNYPIFPPYSVPGWTGYSDLESTEILEPFSFGKLLAKIDHPLDPNLEAYLISGEGANFEIEPLERAKLEDASEFKQGWVLVINPTFERKKI